MQILAVSCNYRLVKQCNPANSSVLDRPVQECPAAGWLYNEVAVL